MNFSKSCINENSIKLSTLSLYAWIRGLNGKTSEPNSLKLVFSGGFGTGPQNGIFGSPGGYPRLVIVVLRPFGGQPCKRSGAKHSPPSFSFVVALRAEDPGFVKILGFAGPNFDIS